MPLQVEESKSLHREVKRRREKKRGCKTALDGISICHHHHHHHLYHHYQVIEGFPQCFRMISCKDFASI